MDRIIEVDQDMDKATGMTLGEEILEAVLECIKIKISEDRIIEVDIEETIEMIITKRGRSRSRERSHSGNFRRMIEVMIIVC